MKLLRERFERVAIVERGQLRLRNEIRWNLRLEGASDVGIGHRIGHDCGLLVEGLSEPLRCRLVETTRGGEAMALLKRLKRPAEIRARTTVDFTRREAC